MAKLIRVETERELDQLIGRAKREQWQELILLGPKTESWYLKRLGDVTATQVATYDHHQNPSKR